MGETLSSPTVSTKIERIAELARNKPGAVLTTLAHHIDTDWLREAYRRTRKDGAAGVDGRGATEYADARPFCSRGPVDLANVALASLV